MPRYIDADALIAEYDRVHVGPAGGARKLMVEAPTADVAPKSEVAREIFAEIEKIIDRTLCLDINAYSAYEELKKKYTEEKE